jgi:argininosuccinate lyase/argininosuccinate synthase
VKVALAYSGGLDTSVIARWLAEERGHQVVAVLVDVGQELDHDAIEARASAAGVELRTVDAREEFVAGFCLPGLQANAVYEGKYPLVSALARPIIAAKVVEAARATGAEAVAHGCTGKGNDQVRFETTYAALAPDLSIMAPVREARMSRDEARTRAQTWGIPLSAESKVYSVDENLWGRTIECGTLEDPWAEPPADAFAITADPHEAPDEPEEVVVTFDRGVPIALDGRPMASIDLIAAVGSVAGRHGFGRVDMIENRLVGIKSRELYEVPGSLALIAAHRDLEDLTLERDVAHEKAGLERRWAELCYYGQWHGPLHASLRAFVETTQDRVSGDVRLRFYKGSCRVVGRRSPQALYDLSLATYEGGADRFDHRQAEGFVRLWSLPIRTWAARQTEPAAAGPSNVDSPADLPVRGHVEVGHADIATGGAGAAESVVAGTFDTDESAFDSGSTEQRPSEPLWAGRFSAPPSVAAMAFTRSIHFDRRLATYDVRATSAHVLALRDAGVLTDDEMAALEAELTAIRGELSDGTFPWSSQDEDVHSALERVLIERLGATGAKVHTARSRNDLVATDLRLWVKDAAEDLAAKAGRLATALADQAEAHLGAVMPGYTHLQKAQPVLLSHHLLAHAFPLVRDAERLRRARDGADASPLGAGALAGSTIALATDTTSKRLGFASAFDNSIDAVADRDFALEFLSACTILAVHVSRLAEDIVLWTTDEFGFAAPAEAHATGSSMMPQKRNPDVAELARAKVGRVLGDLVTLATVMKGLPLAYDRDLQEDKEAVFDAHGTMAATLDAMAEMIGGLTFDTERMERAVWGSLFATDVAEYVVTAGMPFRDAHRLVGRIVAELEAEGRTLADVKPDEWSAWSPLLGEDVSSLLDPHVAVERRATPGGPSKASVEGQLRTLRRAIAAD